MADNNNIKEFTAADIEKYWSGKLSSAEMNALEKAAMDDPFLADALEGYANTTNTERDINSLKEKIDERIKAAPVVNIKKKRVVWLRAAAAIIIIAGAGLLLQQNLLKREKSPSLADTREKESEKNETVVGNAKPTDTVRHYEDVKTSLSPRALEPAPSTASTGVTKQESKELNVVAGLAGKTTDTVQNLSSAVVDQIVVAQTQDKEAESFKASDDKVKTDTLSGRRRAFANVYKPEAAGVARAKSEYEFNYDKSGITLGNSFNYRVVDAQKNPVPFANVFNRRDNVGTYTDIKGNFYLLSSDTLLDVQIRSLGYNPANFKLIPSSGGSLVLKEDEEARKQITAQNRKLVSGIVRKDSAELEEPEAGWGYYNTYVANNIQLSGDLRVKNNAVSDVELSFEVDDTGRPVNIKITKSSHCRACDKEAIRLLRDGPKWKRKGKKNKTTISIAIDQ